MEYFETSFRPYTKEQITEGEKLPEKISSITHSVEAGEKLKLNLILEKISEVLRSIENRTPERFVILGSMGMYATLNELHTEGKQFLILEQRIAGGKNDYDVGVHPKSLNQVMDDFGWSNEVKSLQRGAIGNGGEMIDLMGRRELPHFTWKETDINGKRMLVQSPEEMIFEKMTALVNPSIGEQGEPLMGEIKWGIDIKILKAYLALKNGWDDAQVEARLSQKWASYLEDTKYQGLRELVELVESGIPVEEVVKTALQKRLNKTGNKDIRQELLNLFDDQRVDKIDSLLSASNPKQFEASLKALIDAKAGRRLSYKEASKKAEEEFNGLIRHGENKK